MKMKSHFKTFAFLSAAAVALSFSVSSVTQASLVGISDSGTDFEHTDLAGHEWTNLGEIAGNHIDDDHNGKVDDVHGWNFAENYDRFFFREHLTDVSPVTYKLFEIIARKQAKAETAGDKTYWEQNVAGLSAENKEALLAHLNYFGQYAHGTHVSGIVIGQAPHAKLLVSRIFPDDVPPEYPLTSVKPQFFGAVDFIYKLLAVVTNGVFDQVATYLHEQKVDVANYSVGISMTMLAKAAIAVKGPRNPSPDDIAAEARRVYKQFEPKGAAWIASSPGTLFVVAAGNDGTDNDILPTFPANVRADNEITVAATHGVSMLAEFSNYGKRSVDIAAPGVAIDSTVPSLDRRSKLAMSGTSMAAPFVTGVAAHIKDVNPALTPAQIRMILMGTVDQKPWLDGKVISGGVVNPPRAYTAAEMSKSQDIPSAISTARQSVKDQVETLASALKAASSAAQSKTDSHSAPFVESRSLVEMKQWAKNLLF